VKVFRGFANLLPWALPVSDLVGIALTFVIAYALVLDFPMADFYLPPLIVSLMFVPFVFDAFRLYRTWRGDSLPREIIRAVTAWLAFLIGLLILAALLKATAKYSRVWAMSWAALAALWLVITRIALRNALGRMRAAGMNLKRVLLVGDAPMLVRLVRALRENPRAGFVVAGYVAPERYEIPELMEVSHLGHSSRLAALTAGPYRGVEEVWISYTLEGRAQLAPTLEQLNQCTAAIRIVPDLLSVELANAVSSEVAGVSMLDLNRTPITGLNRLVKDAEDRVLAAAAVLLLAPLMLFIALGVKLSSRGPILFRQRRHGLRGEAFEIFKFRTMHLHEETAGRVTQARRDDERVFPFGKFLRRSSLDELPQLFNVLGGRMSLVGPRPHAEAHNRYYQTLIERYMWRHAVKPGMTGWAQVHGLRGETESVEKMEQRLEYDLYYIQNWSIWLDLEILLLTVFRGIINPNAY
jgi:undecaprenyl-phosphate glucose phosphotransferase